MDIDEEATHSWAHMVAGAVAGTAEHCGMFPVDTIKTHMQAASAESHLGVVQTTKAVLARGGIRGLFNGLGAMIMGAAPAHALYFSSWEFIKRQLGATNAEVHPIKSGAAGMVATLLNDAILVPMDTVKQKRQLNLRHYNGTLDCIRTVVRTEGVGALYAGYWTTILMNVPFHFFYFPTYELLRQALKSDPSEHNPTAHVIAGGGAGAIAAALTNPFDVVKTKLQTQSDVGVEYKGILDAAKKIYAAEGLSGFTRGAAPRMVFHSMSAGILWATYEYMKFLLKADHYANSSN